MTALPRMATIAAAALALCVAPAIAGGGRPPAVGVPVQSLTLDEIVGDTVPVTLHWSAKDDSTPAAKIRTRLQAATGDGPFKTVAGPKAGMRRRTVGIAPSLALHRYRARATDGSGRSTTGRAGPGFRALVVDDRSALVKYTGNWTAGSRAGDYAGTLHVSDDEGAAARLTSSSRNVGVVMPRAPALGKVRICADGACKVVDLSAPTATTYRETVFVRNGLDPSAKHTVTVSVLVGRIELDGFVVLG